MADRQRSRQLPVWGGVISDQALQLSSWVGVLGSVFCSIPTWSWADCLRGLQKLLSVKLSLRKRTLQKSTVVPFRTLRAQDSLARWAVGVSVSHLLNEADGVAWTLHWCIWKCPLGGWKHVTLLLGGMCFCEWESRLLPVATQKVASITN